jgi:hypothetical protein
VINLTPNAPEKTAQPQSKTPCATRVDEPPGSEARTQQKEKEKEKEKRTPPPT